MYCCLGITWGVLNFKLVSSQHKLPHMSENSLNAQLIELRRTRTKKSSESFFVFVYFANKQGKERSLRQEFKGFLPHPLL